MTTKAQTEYYVGHGERFADAEAAIRAREDAARDAWRAREADTGKQAGPLPCEEDTKRRQRIRGWTEAIVALASMLGAAFFFMTEIGRHPVSLVLYTVFVVLVVIELERSARAK